MWLHLPKFCSSVNNKYKISYLDLNTDLLGTQTYLWTFLSGKLPMSELFYQVWVLGIRSTHLDQLLSTLNMYLYVCLPGCPPTCLASIGFPWASQVLMTVWWLIILVSWSWCLSLLHWILFWSSILLFPTSWHHVELPRSKLLDSSCESQGGSV